MCLDVFAKFPLTVLIEVNGLARDKSPWVDVVQKIFAGVKTVEPKHT